MVARKVKDTDVQNWLNEIAEYIDPNLKKVATEIGILPSLPSSQFSSYTLNGALSKREKKILELTGEFKRIFENYITRFDRGVGIEFDVFSAMKKIDTDKAKEIVEKYSDPYHVYLVSRKFLKKFPKSDFSDERYFTLLPMNDRYDVWYGGFSSYVGSKIETLRNYVSADMYLEMIEFIQNELEQLKEVYEISKFDEVYNKIIPFKDIIDAVKGKTKLYDNFKKFVRFNFGNYLRANIIENFDSLMTRPEELNETIEFVTEYVAESSKYDIYNVAGLDEVVETVLNEFYNKVEEKITSLPFEVNISNFESYVRLFKELSKLVGDDTFDSVFESYNSILGNKLIDEDIAKKIIVYDLFTQFKYFDLLMDQLSKYFDLFADDADLTDNSSLWDFVALYNKIEKILSKEDNEMSEYYLNLLREEVEEPANVALKGFFIEYVVDGITLESETPYDFEAERVMKKFSGVCNEGLESIILAIKSIPYLDNVRRDVMLSVLGYKDKEIEFTDISVYPPTTHVKKLIDAAKIAVHKLIKRYEEKGLDVELIKQYTDNFVKTVTFLVNNEFTEIGVPFMFSSSMAQNMYYELTEGKEVSVDSLNSHDVSLLNGVICVMNDCDIDSLDDELSKMAAYVYSYVVGKVEKLNENLFDAFYHVFKNFDEITPQYREKIINYFTSILKPPSKEELPNFISELDSALTKISQDWGNELHEEGIGLLYRLSVDAISNGFYEFMDDESREFLKLIGFKQLA